jgi:hypothetical protein
VNRLYSAAAEVQAVCRDHGWPFCFIGGLAVIRWGEPRLTRDVDLTILAGPGLEEPVIDGLLGQFASRLDDARDFAIANRVIMLTASNGVPVNVALGALEFEERCVRRASAWDAGEVAMLTCSAEDLIVHKAFAGRAQDWADVAGVMTRRRGSLGAGQILAELAPLVELKGAGENLSRVRGMLDAAH